MRLSGVLFLMLLPSMTRADAPRYGIAPDPKAYPQATPQQALASVLKAVEARRFDYLAAQLADPSFVDDRVKRLFGGRFEQQVEETANQFSPVAARLLGRFLKDGEWSVGKDAANVVLKDLKDRAVFFCKIGGRWYLENRWK
jgi:hypothetical protein